MAPNKRAENKRLLNLWLDKDVYARFARVADAFGVSMTSILTAYITEKVEEYESKRKPKHIGESTEKTRRDSKGE